MKVIDNFLEPKQFKYIQETIMGTSFPWFYQHGSDYEQEGLSQLVHTFYKSEFPSRVNSSFLEILEPVWKKLNAEGLIRIKANLTYPAKKRQGTHTAYNLKNVTTSIYYINSNNGGTKIKDKVIKSKENRMVTIPGNVPHVVVRHTDNNIGRFIINFNYYEGEPNE